MDENNSELQSNEPNTPLPVPKQPREDLTLEKVLQVIKKPDCFIDMNKWFPGWCPYHKYSEKMRQDMLLHNGKVDVVFDQDEKSGAVFYTADWTECNRCLKKFEHIWTCRVVLYDCTLWKPTTGQDAGIGFDVGEPASPPLFGAMSGGLNDIADVGDPASPPSFGGAGGSGDSADPASSIAHDLTLDEPLPSPEPISANVVDAGSLDVPASPTMEVDPNPTAPLAVPADEDQIEPFSPPVDKDPIEPPVKPEDPQPRDDDAQEIPCEVVEDPEEESPKKTRRSRRLASKAGHESDAGSSHASSETGGKEARRKRQTNADKRTESSKKPRRGRKRRLIPLSPKKDDVKRKKPSQAPPNIERDAIVAGWSEEQILLRPAKCLSHKFVAEFKDSLTLMDHLESDHGAYVCYVCLSYFGKELSLKIHRESKKHKEMIATIGVDATGGEKSFRDYWEEQAEYHFPSALDISAFEVPAEVRKDEYGNKQPSHISNGTNTGGFGSEIDEGPQGGAVDEFDLLEDPPSPPIRLHSAVPALGLDSAEHSEAAARGSFVEDAFNHQEPLDADEVAGDPPSPPMGGFVGVDNVPDAKQLGSSAGYCALPEEDESPVFAPVSAVAGDEIDPPSPPMDF